MSTLPWIDTRADDSVYTLKAAQNSLLQVLLSKFRLTRSHLGFELQVSFDEETEAIRRRQAKDYVLERMPGHPKKKSQIQKRIDGVFFQDCEVFEHNDQEFVFRYASGGTLPIVEIADTEYYCLFYRDVFPIGWNIANGACDSLPELLNPRRTIERELREELIVLALHGNPPCDYMFEWPGAEPIDMPEFVEARRLASQFLADELHIHRDFKRVGLRVSWDPHATDTLRVEFAEAERTVQTGFYLNINAHDFGIELDRIGRIRLESGTVLLDGEINDNRLLNRPIGLFEVHATQKAVKEGTVEFLPDKLFYSAALELSSRPSTDYLSEQIIEGKFFKYLKRQRIRTEAKLNHWRTQREARNRFDLCPVTRQIIRRHLESPRPRVFISYSNLDRVFAEKLHEDLEEKGTKVLRDATYTRGGVWHTDIERALDDSTHVLLIATEASVSSTPARSEIQYALDTNKPVIALIKETCTLRIPSNVVKRVDFRGEYAKALAELIAAIQLPAIMRDRK